MTELKIHEHHEQAAQHYEHAAKYHREAAKHHQAGNHEKAAHHARIAFGHYLEAAEHQNNAARQHAKSTARIPRYCTNVGMVFRVGTALALVCLAHLPTTQSALATVQNSQRSVRDISCGLDQRARVRHSESVASTDGKDPRRWIRHACRGQRFRQCLACNRLPNSDQPKLKRLPGA